MKTITKSIRLNLSEAKELKEISKRECMIEANLLKKIFSLGIKQVSLDEAVTAYMKSEMSVSEIAGYYRIPYGDLFMELKNRNIQILDEGIDLNEELRFLKGK